MLAPFAPFLSESVYKTLASENSLESVHLEDYPEFNKSLFDEKLLVEMKKVRDISSSGLKIRDDNRLKLRQPLSKVYTAIQDNFLQEIIKAELNVKEIEYSEKPVEGENLITEGQYEEYVTLDIKLTEELLSEGYINDFVRQYQNSRKRGEDIDYGDEVKLTIFVEDSLMQKMLQKYLEENKEELNISKIQFKEELNDKTFKLGNSEIGIEVEKI
jgi:isoleucyl-tRNA synthetase